MKGYTKLFSTIVTSTIWQEDHPTRILWITLLALSDADGMVEGSIPGLAHIAHITPGECEVSLAKLQLPDKYSRTQDHDGRRIETVAGGWFILNRAKYRDMLPEEERRERDRLRQQRHRQGRNENVTVSRVTECDSHDLSHQKEKEKEKEKENKIKTSSSELETSSDQASPDSQSKEKATPKPKATPTPSHEAQKLAALLAGEIRANKADYRIPPGRERKWAKTADLMLRRDGRAYDQIADLIRWCQGDEFECSNVVSMEKLRQRFDQLAMKAELRQHPRVSKRQREFEEARKRSRETETVSEARNPEASEAAVCQTCGGRRWGRKYSPTLGWRDLACLTCNPDGANPLVEGHSSAPPETPAAAGASP